MGKEYWQHQLSGCMCASIGHVACVMISTDASSVQRAVVNMYHPLWHYETLFPIYAIHMILRRGKRLFLYTVLNG